MKSKITIRHGVLQLEPEELLYYLQRELTINTSSNFYTWLSCIRSGEKSPTVRITLARVGNTDYGEIIGWAAHHQGFKKIGVFVKKMYRGRGIGRQLAVELLKRLNADLDPKNKRHNINLYFHRPANEVFVDAGNYGFKLVESDE